MLFSAFLSPSLAQAESSGGEVVAIPVAPTFDEVYNRHFDFVWRSLKRLGVPPAQLDDASQDTFVVVLRRLSDFRGASSLRTWLFGILMRVAKDYRRRAARKPVTSLDVEPPCPERHGPEAMAVAREASNLLHQLLETLDDHHRAVFVLTELEQMSAPEIAEALGTNVNTVYSRLRTARRDFETALARHRARRHP
jgi:RNA polymerase sigma-70 factor (ECF subfamily)